MKSTTVRAAAVAALAAVAIAACGPAGESADPSGSPTDATTVTVETYQGPVEVPLQPERVVVFEHGVLDTIDTLGFGDAVVGIPHHVVPGYLDSYLDTATNVGTLFEPDYEAINALEPDLIIVGGRSAPTLPEMQAIAPTIDLTYEWETALFLDTLRTNATAVGAIFGDEQAGVDAVAALEGRAADIAADAADAGDALVILTSAGEVAAYGPDSRFDFVYEWLGFAPAAEQVAIDDHGDAISFEFLAETDADVVFVLDRDAAIGAEGDAARAILDNDLVNGTSAFESGAVVYVDGAAWYLSFGGLTALSTVLDDAEAVA